MLDKKSDNLNKFFALLLKIDLKNKKDVNMSAPKPAQQPGTSKPPMSAPGKPKK